MTKKRSQGQMDMEVTGFVADLLREALRREGEPVPLLETKPIYTDVTVTDDGNIRLQIEEYVCYFGKLDIVDGPVSRTKQETC